MKKCLNCKEELPELPKNKKYCSLKCRNVLSNKRNQQYDKQRQRGAVKKLKLIESLGGSCAECGYNKNIAALCFHHLNPELKTFALTNRECANNSLDRLKEEVKKCILLCHNCHMELHHPRYDLKNILNEYKINQQSIV